MITFIFKNENNIYLKIKEKSLKDAKDKLQLMCWKNELPTPFEGWYIHDIINEDDGEGIGFLLGGIGIALIIWALTGFPIIF